MEIPKLSINELQFNDVVTVDEEVANKTKAVLEFVNSCLGNQNTKTTILTYETLIRKEVMPAEVQLETTLLPLDSEDKFLTLFGWLLANNPDIRWSRVRALKTALVKHHSRNNLPCILESWSPKMSALWAGLSRAASHEIRGKEPIEFQVVIVYLAKTSKPTSPATIRNRAMVVVSFFGVRRSAETRAFNLEDVTHDPNGSISLKDRCPKNDQ